MCAEATTNEISQARPFLKWAGGKGQLLAQIVAALPAGLRADGTGVIRRYAEPFVGSGAVFFYIAQHFDLDAIYLSDVNPELILLYQVVQQDVEALIAGLTQLEAAYLPLGTEARRAFYYRVRADYNTARPAGNSDLPAAARAARSAQMIFLNRTCYNGLFRVNARGAFNVPFGDYKRPRICDAENLRAAARLLQRAAIHCADFTACGAFAGPDTFVYFDPPYRPISRTASFNAYSTVDFDDAAQARLADFCRQLDAAGVRWMLSNSDPANEDPSDLFFDRLYQGFHVRRVSAARLINSNASRRGPITELLVTNYGDDQAIC